MKKGGGYVLATYLLDLLGADTVLMNYLTDSACRSIKYDDRATAISWSGQLLTALRDFGSRFDGHPPAALIRANRDISRRLARYIHRQDLEGGDNGGQVR